MEAILNTVGWPVLAIIVTWAVGAKFGWGKLKSVLQESRIWIDYALRNMRALNALVVKIQEAAADDRITKEELQGIIEEAGKLARELKNRTTLEHAEKTLAIRAGAK